MPSIPLLAPEYLQSLPAQYTPDTPTTPDAPNGSPTPPRSPHAPDTTYTPSGF